MPLVLSRDENQSIVIGDDIFITVCEARNGRARLAITAPKEIRVDRQEVRDLRKAGEEVRERLGKGGAE